MMKDRTSPIPSNPTSVKFENYTNNFLQTDSNPATMEVSGASCSMRIFCQKSQAISDETSDKSPATESSDQTKAAKHEPLVYRVEEIAQLLAISPRAAYNLCNTTKDFRVLRIGTSIRVNKQSFDNWFAAV